MNIIDVIFLAFFTMISSLGRKVVLIFRAYAIAGCRCTQKRILDRSEKNRPKKTNKQLVGHWCKIRFGPEKEDNFKLNLESWFTKSIMYDLFKLLALSVTMWQYLLGKDTKSIS